MNKPIIPIIFATNNGYAPYASVAINSLVANSSKEYFYDIHVFHTELNEKNIKLLESACGENYSVSCLCVERYIEREMKYMYTNFHFSKEMFYRILIPSIFPEYDRAIYLDCDVVVLSDISEFYKIDLEGNIIGGVNDIMHGRSKNYVINELGMDPFRYINSGVLLIDCKAFRDNGIKEKCFEELAVRTSLRYPDQDIINLACAENIKFLERKWNYIWHYHIVRDDPTLNLPESEMAGYLEDAKDIRILHYTSGIKPWKNKNVSLSSHFWKYVKGCPFEAKIENDFAAISMKSYIGYQFLDVKGENIKLTASLYTIEGLTYDDVILSVDGNEYPTEFDFVQVIEISGKTYNRSFFHFSIDPSLLSDNARVVFYNKKTGLPFSIISSYTFPVDFSLCECFEIGDRLIYKENKALIFALRTEELVQAQKTARLNALNNLKNDEIYKKAKKVRALYRFLKPFFRKDVWLISDRSDSAADNGEAFFKYLSASKPKGIKPVFLISKASKDYKRLKKYGKVIAPESAMHHIYYLFATANISSHLERQTTNPIYCAKYLSDILSKCKTVFLQHGITKDDISFSYNRCKDNMDLFITAAKPEYDSIVSTPKYVCDEGITALTGFPRYDLLEDKTEKTVFIIPTWRKYCVKDMKTLEFTNEIEKTQYFKFYSALLHDTRLIDAAKKNGYKLCYYPHHIMSKIEGISEDLDKTVFADPEQYTYNDVFCRGALMLTDYSSTQFDFAYLRKPIVYTHFDKDAFFTSHSYVPGYFDYERDGFGEVVYDLDSTVAALIEYMENGCKLKDMYRERTDDFFAFSDKNNSKRVFERIKALAEK